MTHRWMSAWISPCLLREGKLPHFPLAKRGDCALSVPAMTRPQVEICAKLLMVAIVLTFIWGAYNVLALMGLV